MVLRVDKDKGYIDLSKRCARGTCRGRARARPAHGGPLLFRGAGAVQPRAQGLCPHAGASASAPRSRVSPEDVTSCEDKYNKSKMVHSIARHVAELCGVEMMARGASLDTRRLPPRPAAPRARAPLLQRSPPSPAPAADAPPRPAPPPPQELMDTVIWPLYRKYGHAFEAFKQIGQDPTSILGDLTKTVTREGGATETVPAVTPEMREAFVVNIRRRMTPTPLKIRADVELTCFAYDGVLHIKARRLGCRGAGGGREGARQAAGREGGSAEI